MQPNSVLASDKHVPPLTALAGSLPSLPEGVSVEEAIRQAKLEHYLPFDE